MQGPISPHRHLAQPSPERLLLLIGVPALVDKHHYSGRVIFNGSPCNIFFFLLLFLIAGIAHAIFDGEIVLFKSTG